MTLNVFYKIGGTASNGVDYAAISNHIVIPAGIRTNSILISPINSGQTNTKTVVLELTPSPMLNLVNYRIGSPDQATVYILPDGVTNIPPVVRITNPQNGAVFRAPIDIPLYAYATDPDDGIASVEFFANGNSLGLANHIPCATPLVYCPTCPVRPCQSAVYVLQWTNVPLGKFSLTAVGTDVRGASTVSDPITVSILPLPPPPTNQVPIVSVSGDWIRSRWKVQQIAGPGRGPLQPRQPGAIGRRPSRCGQVADRKMRCLPFAGTDPRTHP